MHNLCLGRDEVPRPDFQFVGSGRVHVMREYDTTSDANRLNISSFTTFWDPLLVCGEHDQDGVAVTLWFGFYAPFSR